MKETIIYSSKINSTELLRTLSLFGNNVINYRVFNLHTLIDDTNVKTGFKIKDNILNGKEIENLVLLFFIDKIDIKSPTYQDVLHFLSTLNTIRKYITSNDEISAIKEVISQHKGNKSLEMVNTFVDAYFDSLGDNVDSILFARKVIECISKDEKPYEEICYFKEDYISPFEMHMINSLAKSVKEISVESLFNNIDGENKLSSINPRYGTRNEIAHVIKDIVINKYPLSECEIVLINKASYANELYEVSHKYNLKMTYECGLPINISDAFKLYSTIEDIENKNFYDVNGYIKLFACESLDLEKLGVQKEHILYVSHILGRLKFCFDESINKSLLIDFDDLYNNHNKQFMLFLEKIERDMKGKIEELIPIIKHVVDELSKGKSYFIKEYTKLTDGNEKLYKASVDCICNALDICNSDAIPEALKNSYIESIKNKYICNEIFNDESLHVTSIDKALSTVRKHIYIVGLNAQNYPGGLTEDFLFNDKCYEELCGVEGLTENSLTQKNEYLKAVIDTYLHLGSDVKLSFSCQDIAGVRELNPCSVLLDYAEEFFPHEDDKDLLKELTSKCSYYDDELSSLEEVVRIAINNDSIQEEKPIINGHEISQDYIHNMFLGKDINLEDRGFSPSSLPSFIKCPLRFYLDYIAKIDNTIEYDPLRPIGGNRFGDLFHYVMEIFIKEKPNASLDEILKDATELYDLYTKFDRSVSDDEVEKKPFLNSVENAYYYLKENFDLSSSKTELRFGYKKRTRINGVWFRGSIDLVTKNKEGKTVILDFKTGNKIDHEDNDASSCIQGLIYSQCYEQEYNDKPVQLVFFYTRSNKEIIFDNPCGENAKKELNERVEIFKNALVNKTFPITTCEKPEEDVCKYCKYGKICKIKEKLSEPEEDKEEE